VCIPAGFIEPARVQIPNGISIGSAVFGRPLQVTVSPIAYEAIVLSVLLSVTLVYCGQTVGWIKMPLGREVGLGPADILLQGDQLLPPTERGTAAPVFRPMSIVAKWLDGSGYHLVLKYRPQPRRQCFRWGPSSPPPRKGALRPPLFGPCL